MEKTQLSQEEWEREQQELEQWAKNREERKQKLEIVTGFIVAELLLAVMVGLIIGLFWWILSSAASSPHHIYPKLLWHMHPWFD
ncbi:MAG: hypothetical protein IJR99_06870 [Kiritimatiellae bacterium]|nr:hypothetical protein [Kiritimatiellia bacterium]